MSRDLFIIQRCRINFLIAIFMIFGASAVNSCDAWMSGVHPNTINGIPYFNGSWFRHCQQKGVKKKKENPIFPFIICGQSLMRAFSCEICSHKHIWYTSFRLLQAYHKQTKLSNLLKLAKGNVSWQNLMPRRANSDQQRGRWKWATTAKQECTCQKCSKTKSLHMRQVTCGCLLYLKYDFLKDTQMPALTMFKLEKARWTLHPAFLQCSKHVKIICIINNKIT